LRRLLALFVAVTFGLGVGDVASATCAVKSVGASTPTTAHVVNYDLAGQHSSSTTLFGPGRVRTGMSSTDCRSKAVALGFVISCRRVVAADDAAAAAEGALPELSASRSALEAKFKHAGDFGVTEGRGAAGFDAYGKAIDSFVGDSATTRVLGTYRGDPAILNYNANTAQVVVQGVDGSFISGWQMSPAQLQNVIERGSLGGG
jgi:hypothetical protein